MRTVQPTGALAKRAVRPLTPRRRRPAANAAGDASWPPARGALKGCRMGKKWLVPKLALLNYLHGGEGLRSA